MTLNHLVSPPGRGPAKASAWLWLGRNGWALTDQVLISATNFITMVLLARALPQGEFGSFTLVYSTILLTNILQSTLITQPHNVLGSTRHGEPFILYTSSIALAQAVLAGGLAVLGLAAAAIATAVAWHDARLLWVLGPAIVAWQSQEFCRRVLYTTGRYRQAFINDLAGYGGQAASIAILYATHTLSGARAIWILTAMAALATLLGVWQIRHLVRWHFGWDHWGENWHFGKWLAGAEILGWCSSLPMYMFLASAVLGTAAAGQLKAAQIAFGPTRMLAFFLSSILPMQFARALVSGGPLAVHRQLKTAYAVIVPLLGAYCLFVVLLAGPLLRLLYGERYASDWDLLALYACYEFLEYTALVVSASLSAKRMTRAIFLGYLARGLIVLPLGLSLLHFLGLEGVVVAMVTTTVVGLSLFWRSYLRSLAAHRLAAAAAPVAPACITSV